MSYRLYLNRLSNWRKALERDSGIDHGPRLAYPGHAVIENRNGLIVNAKASGRAEPEAATELLSELPGKQPTRGV